MYGYCAVRVALYDCFSPSLNSEWTPDLRRKSGIDFEIKARNPNELIGLAEGVKKFFML